MRITEGIIANTILNNLQSGQGRLERLQQQASSGLKLSTPGDDPVSAQQVIQLKGIVQDADQFSRNIATGTSWLEQSDSSMADMGNVVTRARELAMQMANGTYSAQERTIAASELNQLKNEIVQYGNSQVAGKYIFGGFVSDKPPFDAASGAYIGTNDPVSMEVDRGAYVTINVPGGSLLRGGTPPGSTGTDIIGELDKLTTALSINDLTGIRAALPALQNAQNQILAARGDVGARMNRVQSASDKLESMKISLNKVISSKQDADYLQVISDLTNQQNAFQAALASSAKTSQLSLLDYLK
jgi:flagellar hook-associated protein 3 FlgL